MICKKCKENISSDCVLTGIPEVEGICVFCYYKIDNWDSNGQLVTKKEVTMLEVNAIQCNKCGDIVFSRARHDCRGCSCGNCFIDGGFDYMRIGGNDLDKIINKKILINQTKKELYDDWNKKEDKYGIIKNAKSKNKRTRK